MRGSFQTTNYILQYPPVAVKQSGENFATIYDQAG